MNRNTKEQHLLDLRRLQREREELRERSREVEYVTLEEPQFVGWEIKATLSDSGFRRADSTYILEAINASRLSEPLFTRNVRYIREIRAAGYKYSRLVGNRLRYKQKKSFIAYWNDHFSPYKQRIPYHHKFRAYKTYKYGVSNFNGRSTIDQKIYNTLSHKAKSYYTSLSLEKVLQPIKGIRYRLNWELPWYELVFKITKSYYTQMPIPNSDAQSKYQKLDDRLDKWKGKGLEKSWNGKWSRYHRDSYVRGIKSSWRVATKQFANTATKQGLMDEDEEFLLSRTKAYKRDYGWT